MSLHPSMDIVADALQGYAEKQTGNNLIKLLRALTIMLFRKTRGHYSHCTHG